MWLSWNEGETSRPWRSTLQHERSIHCLFPQAAGADVPWHFPMAPSYAFKDWAADRNWILYVEPKCDLLAKKLYQLDKQHELASGVMIGAARPFSLEERQSFQFGPEAAPRFTPQGERIVPPARRGPTLWTTPPSPPPPWNHDELL